MAKQDKDSELLKEAIADAQTIKEVALQNAKDVLEEAFTTRLQSMISDRIQREAEEEMGYDDIGGDYEADEEDEEVSGSAEVESDPETGDLEGLELDLDFGGNGEEMEEPTDDDMEDMEDMGDLEDEEGEEPEEAPTGDTGEEDEEDIDLEEVLEFLEGEGTKHEEGNSNMDMDHMSDMDRDDMDMDYMDQDDMDMDHMDRDDMDHMDRDHMSKDSDIREIIQDLEEDIEDESDLDEQIEEFLSGLDETVYDVDLNELQESVSRSSKGQDDVFEIDVDRLEEEYGDVEYRVGTEGHEYGGYYDEESLDGYEPVSGADIGNHGPDEPAPGAEEDIGMPGPSSPDLGEPQSDTGYYDDSSFDGYEPVSDRDVVDHGPDEPAPGVDRDLGEDDISYGDLLSELEGPSSEERNASRSQNVEKLREQNEELREKLDKHRQAVKILRNRINEVNLINSKLLYTNRLFKRYNLNENQKLRVIEALDRAKDKRGAKLVYSTLSEAFETNTSRKSISSSSSSSKGSSKGAPSSKGEKKNLAEAISRGMSSKSQGSQEPESPETKNKILNEDVEMKSRMQKLADIHQ